MKKQQKWIKKGTCLSISSLEKPSLNWRSIWMSESSMSSCKSGKTSVYSNTSSSNVDRSGCARRARLSYKLLIILIINKSNIWNDSE